jgi:exopolysaccharide biosynthesis polyprenyl glycosylphosphotransferase
MTNDRLLERAFVAVDLAAIALSLWVSDALRGTVVGLVPGIKPTVPAPYYLHLLLVFLPTWVWCAERLDLHRIRLVSGPLTDLLRALLWAQASGGLAIALILVAAQVPMNRSLIALFLAVSTLVLLLVKLAQRRWLFRHRGEAVALVVGDDDVEAGGEMIRLRRRRVENLASLDAGHLRARLHQGGVDEVVLPGTLTRERLRPLIEAAQEIGIPALVRLERADLDLVAPRAERIGAALYLSYERTEPDRPSLLVKAVLDRLVAAAGLLVTLPLTLPVALAIKLSSPGPVLFIQQRAGLNGRPFPMFKFRTMRVSAEAERAALLPSNEMDGPVFKIANDPRVTPLGRWLRRTSVDELPQLLNVLLGHMSLVGPRPLPLVEITAITGGHRRRLSVRPGITCIWQVSGRNMLPFEEWMALDLRYIDNWSLGLDLAILMRTLPALVSGRGAR